MADVDNPERLFEHELGTALYMERTVVSMLRELEEKANDAELKQMLSHHRDETEQQIENLGRRSPPSARKLRGTSRRRSKGSRRRGRSCSARSPTSSTTRSS